MDRMRRAVVLAGMLALSGQMGLAQEPEPATKKKECKPGIGCVTDRPLPRYVTLKTSEGNARRGPGPEHRIDWEFKRAGMPLKLTAEHDNWRRVEDAEGEGGWMHYSLLSGTRTVLVMQNLTEFLADPDDLAEVTFQAEQGVIGRLLECNADWCRVSIEGQRGWVRKGALWGVDATEVIE
ncbi:MAG: SH3 domain-containing protein [Paracoccaceae bacterium]